MYGFFNAFGSISRSTICFVLVTIVVCVILYSCFESWLRELSIVVFVTSSTWFPIAIVCECFIIWVFLVSCSLYVWANLLYAVFVDYLLWQGIYLICFIAFADLYVCVCILIFDFRNGSVHSVLFVLCIFVFGSTDYSFGVFIVLFVYLLRRSRFNFAPAASSQQPGSSRLGISAFVLFLAGGSGRTWK